MSPERRAAEEAESVLLRIGRLLAGDGFSGTSSSTTLLNIAAASKLLPSIEDVVLDEPVSTAVVG